MTKVRKLRPPPLSAETLHDPVGQEPSIAQTATNHVSQQINNELDQFKKTGHN